MPNILIGCLAILSSVQPKARGLLFWESISYPVRFDITHPGLRRQFHETLVTVSAPSRHQHERTHCSLELMQKSPLSSDLRVDFFVQTAPKDIQYLESRKREGTELKHTHRGQNQPVQGSPLQDRLALSRSLRSAHVRLGTEEWRLSRLLLDAIVVQLREYNLLADHACNSDLYQQTQRMRYFMNEEQIIPRNVHAMKIHSVSQRLLK